MEQVKSVIKNIDWLPIPNQCAEVITNKLPPKELVTTAFVLAFHEGRLLLSKLYHSWDTPGGHNEKERN